MSNPIANRVSRGAKIAIASLCGISLLLMGFTLGARAMLYAPPQVIAIPIPVEPTRPDKPKLSPQLHQAAVEINDRWKYTSLTDEIKCLADNMYFEGRNQTTRGKIGIGLATINRVKSKHFKDSVCEVVWFKAVSKRTGKMTAHFSWTLDGKSDKIKNHKAYVEIYQIAEAMLAEGSLDNFYDFTEGATHYHADYITPYWATKMTMIAQIGDHIYYR